MLVFVSIARGPKGVFKTSPLSETVPPPAPPGPAAGGGGRGPRKRSPPWIHSAHCFERHPPIDLQKKSKSTPLPRPPSPRPGRDMYAPGVLEKVGVNDTAAVLVRTSCACAYILCAPARPRYIVCARAHEARARVDYMEGGMRTRPWVLFSFLYNIIITLCAGRPAARGLLYMLSSCLPRPRVVCGRRCTRRCSRAWPSTCSEGCAWPSCSTCSEGCLARGERREPARAVPGSSSRVEWTRPDFKRFQTKTHKQTSMPSRVDVERTGRPYSNKTKQKREQTVIHAESCSGMKSRDPTHPSSHVSAWPELG